MDLKTKTIVKANGKEGKEGWGKVGGLEYISGKKYR